MDRKRPCRDVGYLAPAPRDDNANAIDGLSVPSPISEYLGANGENVSATWLSPCPVSETAISVRTAGGGSAWVWAAPRSEPAMRASRQSPHTANLAEATGRVR